MNVTELARVLRVTPQELRDLLPQLGFDIGQKAIKIDNRTANRIIKEWPGLMREYRARKSAADEKLKEGDGEAAVKKEVKISRFITVKDFSALSGVSVSKILAELMKNGIFTSLNEKIDFDTAWLMGSNLGLDVKLDETAGGEKPQEENKLKQILDREEKEDMIARSPVIVVMGHVDHGKTKLLDAIRSANVVAGEAGGITQHIGAYQITRKNKIITFIDTPGHEAFTAMRSRGAKVADVAILVVAADDGVKPQTVEALSIIKAAKIPFLVAMNKIDKPEANIDKTKQELSNQLGITPEDWGGKTICVPISAKDNIGIDELLDMVLLTTDMEVENIKANPKAKAVGTVVESHINKGEGPVATILIQNGTLRVGDQLVFNNQIYGKARGLKNYKGETINEAGPSVPVRIIGLKLAPAVGDVLEVGEGEKMKSKQVKAPSGGFAKTEQAETENANIQKINLVIKSDVLGSAEAIEESLAKINTREIKANIIYKGLGNITDGDITRAEATGALVIGFNVKVPPQVEELARDKNVSIKMYEVIYHLINDIKEKMQELVVPEINRVDLGRLKVMAIFRTEPKSQIVGGKVIDGIIEAGSFIEVMRDKELIDTGKLVRLQSGKQDVKLIETDQECGIQYEGSPVIQVDDILQFYKEEKVIKKL